MPLVLELKGREGDDDGFAMAVLDTIEDYDGPVALMSFDHWLLKDLTAIGTSRPVGLTAEGARPENFAVHEEAMQLGLDFISYLYGHSAERLHQPAARPGRQVSTGPCATTARTITRTSTLTR